MISTKTRGAADMAAARFPPTRESPHRARAFVAERLRANRCDGAEDIALLLVSELVTNAVLHAQTEARVEVECRDSTVHVAVTDGVASGIRPDAGRLPNPVGAPSGRGLGIVEAMAERWGVSVHEAGKTVWFEVDATGSRPRGGSR